MTLFLFLDDWMLDATRDVQRRWAQGQKVDVEPFFDAKGYACVRYDAHFRKYRCWYRYFGGKLQSKDTLEDRLQPEVVRGKLYAESSDGYTFEPCDHGGPTDPQLPERKNAIFLPRRKDKPWKQSGFDLVLIDEKETDESKRYKAAGNDGFLFDSPDGIRWTPRYDQVWEPYDANRHKGKGMVVPEGGKGPTNDSDTLNNLIFNPVTGRYQIFCRPGNLDRRMAITESEDLMTWTTRRVVLQPDVLDSPRHQFYGMVVFWYEDLFLGLLWDYFVPDVEPPVSGNQQGRVKMCGYVDSSLAYSYDGLCWLRGPRTPLLPREPMGEFGWVGHYADSLVCGPDDVIRLYSSASLIEHGSFDQQRELWDKGEGDHAMRVYSMRKDGFAYLEPVGGHGWVRTRGFIPKDGKLSINYQAPLGEVQVQVCDTKGDPYPGFSFEDCDPLRGDELAAEPRWKGKKLEELVGKWVRLEFKLFQSRLFAYRWNCDLHYGLNPQKRI